MAKTVKLGSGRGAPGYPRPSVWITGPDPVTHRKYQVWLQQKNQANFRNEGWDLPFDTWCEMWEEHWHERGRASQEYCMTRTDYELPWTKENVEVVTRKEHLIRHRQRQKAMNTGLK